MRDSYGHLSTQEASFLLVAAGTTDLTAEMKTLLEEMERRDIMHVVYCVRIKRDTERKGTPLDDPFQSLLHRAFEGEIAV
jgi:hypothetical protein